MKQSASLPIIRSGDVVRLRDKSFVYVTDAPMPGPYETISRAAWFGLGKEVVTSSMPGETIFVGYAVNQVDGNFVKSHAAKSTVVTDRSEVVAVFN